MIVRRLAIAFAVLAGVGCVAAPAVAEVGAAALREVNPFMGTGVGAADFGTGGGSGATFPGASLPFGMVQFSPDTIPTTANFAGGYSYGDRQLRGFGLDHFSGAGCAMFQDVPILPTTAPVTIAPRRPGSSDLQPRYIPTFSHAHESASPGSYRVTLDPGTPRAIESALTATTRTADGRFTFPRTRHASVLFDVGGSALANYAAAVHVDAARREVSGSATSGNVCFQPTRYKLYFVARFSRPFVGHGTWVKQRLTPGGNSAADANPKASNYKPVPGGPPSLPGNPSTGAQAGAYVSFDTRRGRQVMVQVGVSFTSLAGAKRNLDAEAAGRSFAALRSAAQQVWIRQLAEAQVSGGSRRDRALFYTSLYHALLDPNTFSDVDGRYRGMDGSIHVAHGFTMLANVSGWDVYRAQTQLMAMLAPRRASDLVRSLLADAAQSGCLPRWPYANQQTNIMVGDPSDPIIADAYAFGARGFSLAGAVRAVVRGATRPCHTSNGDYTEREALRQYLRLGYVPQELNSNVTGHTLSARSNPWGTAATTLEYALADFTVSRLAAAAGDRGSSDRFLARSGNWRRILNPATGYVQPRFSSGAWLHPFDPSDANGFVEGNGAQYTWLVPQDAGGLIRALGGRAIARRRLDQFFARLNAGPTMPYAYLGNEPTLATPWLYDWAGTPARASVVARRALRGLYAPTPDGMPGNDDGGTMSAWWVLASLGLYPAIPGTDTLALSAPLFPQATLHLPAGTVHISAPGADRAIAYIRTLRVGNKPWSRTWLTFAQLRGGAWVRFGLTRDARVQWGTAPADAPPSYPPPARLR
ncbi:MAG: GH92 family glycosyl hydrolase [Solirubrobacterales bacterium]|nr:GH92 family glycosyl hydrolase [Solirubrobacterales bacterium]